MDSFCRMRTKHANITIIIRYEFEAMIREILSETQTHESVTMPEKKRWFEIIEELTGTDPRICPVCKQGRLKPVKEIEPLKRLKKAA